MGSTAVPTTTTNDHNYNKINKVLSGRRKLSGLSAGRISKLPASRI